MLKYKAYRVGSNKTTTCFDSYWGERGRMSRGKTFYIIEMEDRYDKLFNISYRISMISVLRGQFRILYPEAV